MNYHKIIKYLCVTYLFTWAFWWARAYLCNIGLTQPFGIIGAILYVIGGFGPTVATIMFLDNKSFKGLMNYLFERKKGTVGYIIFFSIALSLSFYTSTFKLAEGTTIFAFIGALILFTFIAGSNEEVGWSGILFKELEKKFGTLLATLIRTVIWAFWHLPLFFTVGDIHYTMPVMSFVLFLFTLAVICTALIKRTNCLFYCGIIHGVGNVMSTFVLYEANTVMTVETVIIWIIAIIMWYFPKNNNLIEHPFKQDDEVIATIKNIN